MTRVDSASDSAPIGTPLILLFTGTAGSIDAITFLSAHVFTANMTGNTALLGIYLGLGQTAPALHSLLALASYVCGVAGGVLLTRGAERPAGLRPAVAGAVVVEAAAVAVFAALRFAAPTPGAGSLILVLVVISGVAMGIQSAAVMRLQLPGMMTTYLTGTITTFVFAIAARASGARARDAGDGFERRTALQFLVFATYATAALISAALHSRWPSGVAVVPLLAIASVALALVRLRQRA